MKSAHRFAAVALLAAALCTPAAAQVGNTNGSTGRTPETPNFVAVPGIPTMYINGGGANAAGTKSAQFVHDWGKYGMEAAHDCDRKEAMRAIAALENYLSALDGQYQKASAGGADGSVILNDASVVASIINYIRQALAACAPPEHAMLVPSSPPGEEYAALPGERHDDNPLGGVSIGIGIGVGIGGGHDDRDHHHHHDDNHGSNDDHGSSDDRSH